TAYYLAHRRCSGDEVHFWSWARRQPGGFADAEIEALEAVIGPLSRVAEIRAWYRVAGNLLTTYVGKNAGERVLAGHIRRGDTEVIHAAIWLSDMRGFTALADRLPPQVLTDLLNRYFDCQVPAIVDRGGEVLKFIGDGLLAIFPVEKGRTDTGSVCSNALAAAFDVRTNIAKLGRATAIEGVDEVRFGLALHLGDVLYGNIGGGNRLDFTCIGPAVNLAARLEKVAAQLGQSIVASAEFAAHVPGQFTPLGEYAVAGFAAPQKVFGLTAPPQ